MYFTLIAAIVMLIVSGVAALSSYVLQDLILNAEVYDDDVLYKLSAYIEPRGGGEPSGERPPQLRNTEVPKVSTVEIFR